MNNISPLANLCKPSLVHHSCQAISSNMELSASNRMGFARRSLPARNGLAMDFARRSRSILNMNNRGLRLLPFMLYQECRPGPTWEYPNQWQEGMPMFSEYLDARSMYVWVLSCLSCAHYEGCCPFTGWSPFRSVSTNTGWYKVGDRGCWDIQLYKPCEVFDPAAWWVMTLKFARVAGYVALKYFKHTTTLWELFERELAEMPSPMDEMISSWLTSTPQQLLKILAEHSVEAYYTARRMMLPEKSLIANSCFTSFAIALARTSRAQQIMISRCMPRFGVVPSKLILEMLGFMLPRAASNKKKVEDVPHPLDVSSPILLILR